MTSIEAKLTHVLLRCCYWAAFAKGNSAINGAQARQLVRDEAETVDIDSSSALEILARAEATLSHHDQLLIALNLFDSDRIKQEMESQGVGSE